MNVTFRAGWLVATLMFFVAALPAQNSVDEILEKADKLYDLYSYKLALNQYSDVLKRDPKNIYAQSRIGDCQLQLNNPKGASDAYASAIKKGRVQPFVHLNQGKALMMQGNYTEARKAFDRYAESNPDVGEYFSEMCDYAISASKKDPLYQVKNEALVNSKSAEFSPAMYGSKLVFNSSNPDLLPKPKTKKTDKNATDPVSNILLVTQRNSTDGTLQKPETLRKGDLQKSENEGPVAYSSDTKRMVFCRNNFVDGTRQVAETGMEMSMFYYDTDKKGATGKVKSFRFNGSDFATGFPSLSADGETIYFASNDPDGYGGWDIYVAHWNGTDWGKPVNLGKEINTPGNEITPFFDGTDLYFASDWHPGLGGLDLFKAQPGGDDDSFEKVTNLGPGANSPRDDYGYVFDAKNKVGYFTSNRTGGKGLEDIYQIVKKLDEFTIEVVDESGDPVDEADIDFTECGADVKTTDRNGRYTFAVRSGKANCTATVRKDGYMEELVDIRSSGEKNITVTLTERRSSKADKPITSSFSGKKKEDSDREKFAIYVYDENSDPVYNAEIDGSDCDAGLVNTDRKGNATISAYRGYECNLVVRKEGYDSEVIKINNSTKNSIPVQLKSSDKVGNYAGKVLNSSTTSRVTGVTVSAVDTKTGVKTQTTTNSYGEYVLELEPSQIYRITYSKKGYDSKTVVQQTDDVITSEMALQTIFLKESEAAMTDADDLPVEYANKKEKSNIYVISEEEPSTDPDKVTGWAVQLSATPDKISDEKISKFDDVKKYGKLYVKTDKKLNKVRLGVYETKAEALEVNKQVVKKHKDAFVVEEPDAEPSMIFGKKTEETLRPDMRSTSDAKAAKTSGGVKFAVQIESIDATKPFTPGDYSSLNYFGNVYMKPENGLMKVRVGKWASHEEASNAQAAIVKLGYKEATVVAESDEEKPSVQAPKGIAPVQHSTTTAPKLPEENKTRYYVRVCAITDPDAPVDEKDFKGLGYSSIEKWEIDKSDLVALMLAGYTEVESAILANEKLHERGYKDSYIVKEENGKLVRIKY